MDNQNKKPDYKIAGQTRSVILSYFNVFCFLPSKQSWLQDLNFK